MPHSIDGRQAAAAFRVFLMGLALPLAGSAAQPAPSPVPVAAGGAAATASTSRRPAAEWVAVLITDWAEPEGFDPLYRREVVKRSFGTSAARPDEPCTEDFVGTPPFRVQLGLQPYALGFPAPGLEALHDSVGFYKLSADGQTYVSIYDPQVTLAAKDVPATPGMITPAKDFKRPLQRSFWAVDPRDGTNYLEGVVVIGAAPMGPGANPLAMPNGIRDADEYSWAGGITDFSILHEDLEPRLSPATVAIESHTAKVLDGLFDDQIDVRFGAYAPTTGLTRFEEDVALDFAREGFRRMVLVRETTDNNNYANDFMTKGYVKRALCLAGLGEQFQYQQSRQVGRTPEYNLALLHLAKKHLDNIEPGSEVAILYTTYGLPFPDRPAQGPFSAPHPWSKEVYHENAYNNYVSFKRYLEAYYGDRYALHFNPQGRSGDRRRDNYYSYGLAQPQDFTTGYAHNIRSAVERFGVFPTSLNLQIVARGAVDREGGGGVEVKQGALRGAKLVVAKDAHPGEPESFDARNYRAFQDPADNLVSAWDSFEAYVGAQDVPIARLAEHSEVVSPAVLFGPYRTIVNRPASFTLPVTRQARLAPAEIPRLRAFVYNEASRAWDPVFTPTGSTPLRYDPKSRAISASG
ncbi:MAG: hypothetical protein IT481_00685 [Gammaproteobacteria bacterium]|nr:hypothetical protein [Gammaproteobacteria bacterium]